MLDKELRREEAKKAQDVIYRKLDQYFAMLLTNNSLTKYEIKCIEEKTGIAEKYILKRLNRKGYQIVENNNSVHSHWYYKKYCEDKPEGASAYLYLEEKLELFHARDFYEFLGYGYNAVGQYKVGNDELCRKAKELAGGRFCKSDSDSAEGKKICAACELAFHDMDSRAKYGEYLQWNKVRKILNQLKEIAEIKENKIGCQQSQIFLKQLTDVLSGEKQAKKVFFEFCLEEHIFYEIGSVEGTEKSKWEEEKVFKETEPFHWGEEKVFKETEPFHSTESEKVHNNNSFLKARLWIILNLILAISVLFVQGILEFRMSYTVICCFILLIGAFLGRLAEIHLEKGEEYKADRECLIAKIIFWAFLVYELGIIGVIGTILYISRSFFKRRCLYDK